MIFDGYDGSSTKDHEHLRRLMGATVAVSVESDNTFSNISQEAFISNVYNKTRLIDLLDVALESDGHTVRRCRGDADTFIVSAVLDHACKGEDVFLFASDTDLLIMLIYFWNNLMGYIIMKSEGTGCWKNGSMSG